MSKPIVVALAALLLAGCAPPAGAPSGYVTPRPASDFTLVAAAGQTVQLGDVLGKKPVVLEFFATWCSVCMTHVTQFKDFQRQYGDRITFYAISIDANRENVDQWLERDAVNYAVLLDPQKTTLKAYNVSAVPQVFGINAAGQIIYADVLLPNNLEEFIGKLLPPAPAQP